MTNLEIENALWQLIADIHRVDVYSRARIVAEYATRIESIKSNRYLNEKQVAAIWPTLFSRRWLQEARRLRKGPRYYVMHRKVVYLKGDVESYIEEHLEERGES